ncbi:MAG: TrmB family transcriptional regulator, partial [Candidatus Eisenbacteria bacterium]|nr:TrmB family transcriptional regulator [Candidatus Eisenbacteria bacterium]
MSQPAQALTELGFTGLEADIYLHLLRESPATGYRIAQGIGKPTANVYKALESLEQKGAILVQEGPNRLVRAVAPDELLAQLERSFTSRRSLAAQALAELGPESEDQSLYVLRSHPQVLERARAMLARAQRIAILDVFPGPLEELLPDLEQAIARGVSVFVEAYRPIHLPGAEVSLARTPEQTVALYPGDALQLVVDAEEWLVALLDRHEPRVIQAVWTASPFLATTLFTCLAADFMQARLHGLLAAHLPDAEVEKTFALHDRLRLRHAPGFKNFQALGGPRTNLEISSEGGTEMQQSNDRRGFVTGTVPATNGETRRVRSPLPGQDPEMIPREVLFGSPERAAPAISPDGTRLAFLAPV